MSFDHIHGTDAVADPRNAATRRALTHRVGSVLTRCNDGLLLTRLTVGQRHPFRCMDGIGILRRRP